jgi:ABC-type glycerol-3-phosphate transport system permease component
MLTVKRSLARTGIVAVLAFIAVVALYPLLFMGLSTFKTAVEYINSPLALPETFSYVENYVAMFNRFDVVRLFLNTAGYAAAASVVCLSASLPAAFAFAKMRFPFRRALFLAMISSLAIPAITFIVPDYIIMANLGLVDSPASVVLLWSATSIPGTVFLLTAFMRGLPTETLEAARVDGARYLPLMLRIIVPMSLPGIITVTIFNVTAWWNDLLIPLIFLQSDEKKTVTVGVATIVQRYSTDYPLLLTGLLMASLPPILAYVFMQRYIRRGLVLGAVK